MTIYNNGEIKTLNGKTADETVQAVFAAHGLTGPRIRYVGIYVDFNDYMGTITDDLRAALEELNSRGYQFTGSVSYYGDDDGGIEIRADGAEEFDGEKWTIRNAYSGDLIDELTRRGYTVIPPTQATA